MKRKLVFKRDMEKDGEKLEVRGNEIKQSKDDPEMLTVIQNNGRTGFSFDIYADRIKAITREA
jgi:hypothetical protein